jgi:histidinol-phosphate phosphatase family protein
MSGKCVFLDRDGVINKDGWGWTEHSYITRWPDFHFLPGVLSALKKFHEAGYKCVVISNQQGVGKGYFTSEELKDITDRMKLSVKNAGGEISAVYYCTHRNEEKCKCRKPAPGLFRMAQDELGIKHLAGMYFIGDTERDIEAGKNAGLKTILVFSGKTLCGQEKEWKNKPDLTCAGLDAAFRLVAGV